jgi:flagellar assembly protein FliH
MSEPPGIGRPFVHERAGDASEQAAREKKAVEEAIREGYNEGLRRAQEELSVEVEAFRAEVQASLQRTADYEREFAERHETRMLEIVARTASRIARTRISHDDEVVVRALREALQALPESTPVRARMHPEDIATVQAEGETDMRRIEWIPDEGITRGGLVLESDFGSIDATVETAEQAAREAIVGAAEPA